MARDEGRTLQQAGGVWIDKLHGDFANTDPQGVRQEAAYAQWFDEEAQRREGRRERLAEATPSVPLPLWFVLVIGASVTITYCAARRSRDNVLISRYPSASSPLC